MVWTLAVGPASVQSSSAEMRSSVGVSADTAVPPRFTVTVAPESRGAPRILVPAGNAVFAAPCSHVVLGPRASAVTSWDTSGAGEVPVGTNTGSGTSIEFLAPVEAKKFWVLVEAKKYRSWV